MKSASRMTSDHMVRSSKIIKRMVKINQDIICKQCIRDDNDVSGVSDEDKKMAWKSYHENFMNT